jgi:hypothetical protein
MRPRELHRSNDTRWNSIYDEIKILMQLQAPFKEFMLLEQQRAARCKSKRYDDKDALPNANFKDMLSDDDWNILQQYQLLLEPCWQQLWICKATLVTASLAA